MSKTEFKSRKTANSVANTLFGLFAVFTSIFVIVCLYKIHHLAGLIYALANILFATYASIVLKEAGKNISKEWYITAWISMFWLGILIYFCISNILDYFKKYFKQSN